MRWLYDTDFFFLGFGITCTHLGIEIQFKNYTEQKAKMITSAGFFAAAWNINRRDYEEYERLIRFGVAEFTEDNHCSMGLNF